MTLKDTLKSYSKETGVVPPFTSRKVERAGYTVSGWLKELKERLEKADDIGKSRAVVQSFLTACERLM